MKRNIVFIACLLLMLYVGITTIRTNLFHRVMFMDIETYEPIAHTHVDVYYEPYCSSSPCTFDLVFSGVTDETGSITLHGHSTRDLNKKIWTEAGSNYGFKIDGYLRWPIKDESSPVVYFIKKHDINFGHVIYPTYFNWDEVEIIPPFNLTIGPVQHLEISPSGKFLYISIGQGGGYASFVYDRETNIAHFIAEIDAAGDWQDDGKLRLRAYEHLGESIGTLTATYLSVNADEPWIVVPDVAHADVP